MTKFTSDQKKEIYSSVVSMAEKFRNDFLDTSKPIGDTFNTLEELGYILVRFPAHKDLSGFQITKGNYKCIFVNSAHSLGRQYFSAWHECYHAYSGDKGSISLFSETKYNEMELKANLFAACILMPEDLVMKYLYENNLTNLSDVSYEQLIKMQNYFRVSYRALITRLIELYPKFSNALRPKFDLANEENKELIIQYVIKVNGDISLVQPTNDFVISQRFYKKLHDNLAENRISAEKAQEIYNFLEDIRRKYER
ncbi:ImmA/IrrE family metallo-endopeptidase [Caldibacillus lycopersici]|uniref:ImmA/IrrE family metallo-endopeptidase n=1 Tax=Perspicuibacillus lycopersici TaxID=1325689 RepID=A0AAE3ISQ5_9BACI|nr:ImmA/IrrE family metallo-endopeptidase [Perspicuibacillus lycopersici]MCU9612741.1 ImmA/IrrE family metallo-endopeptidase [Perspicuibacillus lycopersici]